MQDLMRIRLLGGFGVTSGDPAPRPIHISSPRQRALLAYLALQPSYSESRERLATLVWGDCTDGQARKRFRQSLLRLRREFADAGADPLVGDRDTLALNPAMVAVDAREFLVLSKAATEADLQRAVDLYQGDLLDGASLDVEPFAEWLHQERSRFREIAAQVFERGARAQDQRGNFEGAIAAAERLVALDASNEAAQRQLIDLLARHCGRTAALMRAEAAAQFVKDEFGCELEPETQALIAKLRSAPSQYPDPKAASREEPQAIGAADFRPSSGSAEPPTGTDRPPAILPAAATAVARSRAPLLFLRPGAPAGWIWASGLTGLFVLVAAVAVLRTMGGDGRATGAAVVQSPNAAELGSPTLAASPAAAVSKAVEGGSLAAVIVLPFSPIPPESIPVARLAEVISDDLINNLSRVPGFRVIARSTSIQYAKRFVDVGTLSANLGVHYAIEGDVRLEDHTVRINIALIDVRTRLQVWAERYEHAEADRAAAQDEIVKALARQLHVGVMEARGRDSPFAGRPNATLGKAWAALNLFAFFRGGSEAEQLFQEVLRADPNNVSALTGLGTFKYAAANTRRTSEDPAVLLNESESLLRRANALDPKASLPYYFLGLVATRRGLLDDALALFEKTIEINPSYAPAYAAIGYVRMNSGRLAEAIENIKYSIRLSPKDNYLGLWSQYLGRIYIELGDDAEAERWLTQSVDLMPNSPLGHLSLAAFFARRGDLDQARAQAETLATLAPKVTLDQWIESLTAPCKQEEHRPMKLIAGLRQAVASTRSIQ
jgi:DNA-binding SARP family transcriptional activator/TolB-like protein/Flp pilus assembly protein TadD